MSKLTIFERVKLSEGQQLELVKEALKAYEKHFNLQNCSYTVDLDHQPIDFRWLHPNQREKIYEAKSMADVLCFAKKIIPPTPEQEAKWRRQLDLISVGKVKDDLSNYAHHQSDSKRYYRIEDEDYSYVLAFHQLTSEQRIQIYSADSMAEIKELARSWAQPKQEEAKTAKATPGGHAERYLKSEITRLTTDQTKGFHFNN